MVTIELTNYQAQKLRPLILGMRDGLMDGDKFLIDNRDADYLESDYHTRTIGLVALLDEVSEQLKNEK